MQRGSLQAVRTARVRRAYINNNNIIVDRARAQILRIMYRNKLHAPRR